jgi:hypothetical protein
MKRLLKEPPQSKLPALFTRWTVTEVQSALDQDVWSLSELLYNHCSYITSMKGIYLGIATAADELVDIVSYVGTSISSGGIFKGTPDHLSSKYRSRNLKSDRPKLFYKYVDGIVDNERRALGFVALCKFKFSKQDDIRRRQALSDLFEITHMILLGTLETGAAPH